MQRFHDRRQAGKALAEALDHYRGRSDLIVLGLPRGGVPVAYEVAQSLGAPLDVMVVRKLGVPGQEELALGAIASGDVQVLNRGVIELNAVRREEIEDTLRRELRELHRRERTYRGDRPPLNLHNRTVLLVDDGLATGATMEAALQAARQHQPRAVVAAAPVGSERACAALEKHADEVVCPLMPEPFQAIGLWYGRFDQTSDSEVSALLEQAGR